MTNKLTNRKALAIAINILKVDLIGDAHPELTLDGVKYPTSDIVAKLEAMAASLDNKATSTTRKPTKTQIENEGLRNAIMEFLRERPNLLVTCTDLSKKVPALDGLNNQKISALMRGLVDSGDVIKYVEKGKSVFQLAPPTAEDEGEGE